MGKKLDMKSGTFLVMVGSFALCQRTVQFCWGTEGTRLVVARINDLHPTKLEHDVYTLD